MGVFSDINDPMADIYGQSETLGGIASYLPGQNFAFDRDVITGMIDTLVAQGTSNIGGMLGLEGRIEAGMKALSDLIGFDATQATPEQIQAALNNANDSTAGLINLTVGSNQMLSDADMAAAQEAAAASTDTLGGSTSSLESDADLMGTSGGIVDSTASATSTDVSGATGGLQAGDVVTDDRIVGDYEYVYDAENNVFHYSPFDYEGNRIYTGQTVDASTVGGFDPDGATTGTTKGLMVDAATGNLVVEHSGDASDDTKDTDTTDTGGDNTSGITITLGGDGLLGGSSTVDTSNIGPFPTGATNATTTTTGGGTGVTSTVTNGATTGSANTTVVDGSGDVTGTGDVFNTATDTNNTGETLTTGTSVKPSTVVTKGDDGKDGNDGTDGKDGVNGTDGLNGGDGKDGKDGKDGATGLIMMGMLSSPIANNIFKTEFESNYLRPEYVDRILRGKGMNNNGRNT